MTGKKFMNAVADGSEDIFQIFLDILSSIKTDYCIVGGLAVNAYVDPVVSLDLAVVGELTSIDRITQDLSGSFPPSFLKISSI